MNPNWRQLNQVLPTLDEDTVKRMLDDERKGEQRVTVLVRLHQRYTTLRMMRERTELLGPALEPRAMELT